MKKNLLLIAIFISTVAYSQDYKKDLIELGDIYRDFMFRNTPSAYTYELLDKIASPELLVAKKFITQTIETNNKLTQIDYLKLPDEQTLKFIYIIRQINLNNRKNVPIDNLTLLDSLEKDNILRNQLIDDYYDMLFSGIANKNQPFDLSDVDFHIREYELKSKTEEAIFYFNAMSLCGLTIWGYLNIAKPPNYSKAMGQIEKFPKFNGQPYYQYTAFGFEDFKIDILKDKGPMSYKTYYLDKYYETLINHYQCLNQKKKYKEEKLDLVLGSILRQENYYKYSKRKTELEKLFSEVEK